MLRMAAPGRGGESQQDIKKDLTIEQLAGIGAVTIAWNEIEFMLDVALYSGESLPASCLQDDLPRRRLDDKILHTKRALERWNLPAEVTRSFEQTAAAFSYLKGCRNAVVHSRVFDARRGVGQRITIKGEVQEVLLSTTSLQWLYRQLVNLCFELRCVLAIFDLARNTEAADKANLLRKVPVAPPPEISEWLTRLHETTKEREALGPAPSFTD